MLKNKLGPRCKQLSFLSEEYKKYGNYITIKIVVHNRSHTAKEKINCLNKPLLQKPGSLEGKDGALVGNGAAAAAAGPAAPPA
jgi:hypothetical protein